MNKTEYEKERLEAIKFNEERISRLETFLSQLPLENEINITVSLELAAVIASIKEDNRILKN